MPSACATLTRLEKAAIQFHELIWRNSGYTDDWPIEIMLDADIINEWALRINELRDAIREVRPNAARLLNEKQLPLEKILK
jgi:hypothetical protein